MKIKDLRSPKYKLITGEEETCNFLDGLGIIASDDIGGLLYCLNKSGDMVEEVWGFTRCVPALDLDVTRLK